ncbi:cell wall metabolism sensor histidine kinase WalK [Marmoricola sp. URHB0036]|uniref:sensor histidine kinase n=1 Tax=Marmoricola sp. URHB0036 TaxID=1298863 RepID=UPI000403FEA5|nr:ATP-binding protein [Marmoricola sp. URHB0036]
MRHRSPPSDRSWLHSVALWLGALVVTLVVIALRPMSADPVLSGDWISTGLTGVATVCCFVVAWRTPGGLRRSWILFGTTMAMWTVADLLWYRYGTADGFHSILSVADTMYLLGLVPASLGLVFYPVGRWEPGARARLLLDIVVLGSALLLISELVVLGEVVASEGIGWDSFVYAIYPITDALMAALAALLLLRSSGRPRLDLVLIAAAFAVWTFADNGFALMSVRGQDYAGTAVDMAYVLAPALLALAALNAARSATWARTLRRDLTGWLAMLLPDLIALAALAVCAVDGLDGWAEWSLAATVLALTGTRQLARTLDNQRLHAALERRVAARTQDLEHLSEQHERILDSVGEGIFGVDRERRISFVNPAGAELLGWDAGELLGRDSCRALCTEQHDECLVSMVMALGEPVTQSARTYRRSDDTEFPVEVTAAPMAGPAGVDGAVVIFRDITERTVLDDMKRQFVSSVSHELRTPLSAIRGSLEMLADGDTGQLPDQAQRVVEVGARGTERLTRLVNDIIDIERLEAGTFDIRPRPEDLAPLVVDAADSLVPLAAEREVTIEITDAAGSALCDADRIVQALVNLLGNALKFTHRGGTVQLSAVPADHEILVSVRDEGRGIPPEEFESIFERFHQVQQVDGRKLGGTGLGLPITKAIVERHGGRIWVESELGVGSTFCFTLPLLTEESGGPSYDRGRDQHTRLGATSA